MKVLYISGPISNNIPDGYDELHGKQLNVLNASQVARRCIDAGWAVICPHKNTSFFFDIPWKEMIDMDLELVRRSDAILMIGNWQKSPGALKELECAQDLGKEIFFHENSGIPSPNRRCEVSDYKDIINPMNMWHVRVPAQDVEVYAPHIDDAYTICRDKVRLGETTLVRRGIS